MNQWKSTKYEQRELARRLKLFPHPRCELRSRGRVAKSRARERRTALQKGDVMVGRKPRLSVARTEEALRAAGGIKAVAARMLNVHRATLYRFLTVHPRLVELALELDEEIKDIAEAKVIQAIRDGDMQTARWYLETKGKDRGYSRRFEQTGPSGGPIEHHTKVDLSVYTDAELEQMLVIEEARVKRQAQLKTAA